MCAHGRGATCAAAVATWALVCTRGEVLFGCVSWPGDWRVVAARHPWNWCLREHGAVILLLSSLWGVGTLVGVCTLQDIDKRLMCSVLT